MTRDEVKSKVMSRDDILSYLRFGSFLVCSLLLNVAFLGSLASEVVVQ